MTVYELIQELAQHPADAEVRIYKKKTDEMIKIDIVVERISWHGTDVEIKIYPKK